MIALGRALAGLVALVLLVLVALAGAALAVVSIGHAAGLSVSGLARLAYLRELRARVGHVLAAGAPHHHHALGHDAVAAGAIAVIVGALLIAGLLWPRRERLVVLGDAGGGKLAARTRVLRRIAAALAEQEPGVADARVRVRPYRLRAGGRIVVDARTARGPSHRAARAPRSREEIEHVTREAIERLAGPFDLHVRVRARRAAEAEAE